MTRQFIKSIRRPKSSDYIARLEVLAAVAISIFFAVLAFAGIVAIAVVILQIGPADGR